MRSQVRVSSRVSTFRQIAFEGLGWIPGRRWMESPELRAPVPTALCHGAARLSGVDSTPDPINPPLRRTRLHSRPGANLLKSYEGRPNHYPCSPGSGFVVTRLVTRGLDFGGFRMTQAKLKSTHLRAYRFT